MLLLDLLLQFLLLTPDADPSAELAFRSRPVDPSVRVASAAEVFAANLANPAAASTVTGSRRGKHAVTFNSCWRMAYFS